MQVADFLICDEAIECAATALRYTVIPHALHCTCTAHATSSQAARLLWAGLRQLPKQLRTATIESFKRNVGLCAALRDAPESAHDLIWQTCFESAACGGPGSSLCSSDGVPEWPLRALPRKLVLTGIMASFEATQLPGLLQQVPRFARTLTSVHLGGQPALASEVPLLRLLEALYAATHLQALNLSNVMMLQAEGQRQMWHPMMLEAEGQRQTWPYRCLLALNVGLARWSLQQLAVAGLRQNSLSAPALALQGAAATLTELDISSCTIFKVSSFAALSNLRKLHACECRCEPLCTQLPGLPEALAGLEVLDADECCGRSTHQVIDASSLARATRLTCLRMFLSQRLQMPDFTAMPQLRDLGMWFPWPDSAVVPRALGHCRQLTGLDVMCTSTQLVRSLTSALAQLAQLQRLKAAAWDFGVEAAANMPVMRAFYHAVCRLSQLQDLSVARVSMARPSPVATFDALKPLPALTYLDIGVIFEPYEALEEEAAEWYVSQCKALKRVRYEGSAPTDGFLHACHDKGVKLVVE